MVSQHHLVQQVLDIVRQLIGLELDAHFTVLILILYIMASIGLALLTAPIPAMRLLSAVLVTSSTTFMSATGTSVCVPAFQLRLRSLRTNNQKLIAVSYQKSIEAAFSNINL